MCTTFPTNTRKCWSVQVRPFRTVGGLHDLTKHIATLRAKYRQAYDDPLVCACGYERQLEVDHDHKNYPYAVNSYKCRSCNSEARVAIFVGQVR